MGETTERAWPIVIVFTDDDRTTRADVVLDLGRHHFHCWGRALRVSDDDVEMDEQIAAARALSNLAHELLASTGEDPEAFDLDPVDARR